MGTFRPDPESTHDHELLTEDELLQEDASSLLEPMAAQHAPELRLQDLVPRRLDVRAGDVLGGKYCVERVHASGVLGVTCEAEHLQLGQRVAIKLCFADQHAHPESAARFLRGARLAAQFRGPHVARVLDLGTLESGIPYCVTEHLSGTDLPGVLRVREWLPVSEAVDYVLQVCEGLAEAHVAGLVHRNLKPSNVFLTRNPDGRPMIKVLDFCLVDGPLDPSLTLSTTHAVVRSFGYLAPEQIRDPESVDVRADIWALGAILHELLTGSALYVASSVPGILAAIAADPAPAVSQLRAEIPSELDEVLRRCLEKEPDCRWSDVGTLARQLRRFASATGRDTVDRVIAVLERRVKNSRGVLPPALPGLAARPTQRAGNGPEPRGPGRPFVEVVLAVLAVVGCSVGVGAFVAIHHLQTLLASRAAVEHPVVASLSPALTAPVAAAAPAAAAPHPPTSPAAPRVWNQSARRRAVEPAKAPAKAEDAAVALQKAAPVAAPQTQALFDDAN